MDEYQLNRQVDKDVRQREDRLKGLSRTKTAQRGDFKLCRESDKILNDFKRFKSEGDRKKIEHEYYTLRREYAGRGDR